MSAGVIWSSSTGSGTPRSHNAVLQLHKLHFVHNKGAGAVSEIIEARSKESRRADVRREREHRQKLESLHAEVDHKLKNSLKFGSTSIWTKEERDRIEERRQDPVEAKAKMNGHMKELAQTYRESKTAIAGRVGARAAMNVRSQEDWAEIQAVRQDPEEAAAKMRTHLKELASSYREEKAAMTARLQTSPKQSFWSKEKMAKMQQARQDPEEAAEKMTQLLQRRSMAWMEEKATRIQNLNNLPVMSFWTPEEVAQIELARQDPEEAKAKMKQHMHELETTARERKTDMLARVQASPRMTFWSKEEKQVIEDSRQDPAEAKQKAVQDMQELREIYTQQKREMAERVNVIPKKTFLPKAVLEQRRYVEELRMRQNARVSKAIPPSF